MVAARNENANDDGDEYSSIARYSRHGRIRKLGCEARLLLILFVAKAALMSVDNYVASAFQPASGSRSRCRRLLRDSDDDDARRPRQSRRIGLLLRRRRQQRQFRSQLLALPDFLAGFDADAIGSAVAPFGDFGQNLMKELDIGGGQNLMNELDIGGALDQDIGVVPEAATSAVLESVGRDLLVFLVASVVVTPLASFLGVTPILGYLVIGALLGPFGLDLFSNSKADIELGDFGILFLLFSEGLEVSTSRLQKLTKFLPLGLAQISLCAGVLTAAILLGPPEFVERFVTLDEGLINIQNPIEALVLALAGTLSTSAFVFPVLKEREWEEDESGQAATSILLLQDLAVAPLLVVLPYVVGRGPTDYGAIGFLTAKATLGFGLVIALGSRILQQVFALVAETRSTETFVALCLLVAAGMGSIAKSLGLTDTAGAFAAGVLLANTNYRGTDHPIVYFSKISSFIDFAQFVTNELFFCSSNPGRYPPFQGRLVGYFLHGGGFKLRRRSCHGGATDRAHRRREFDRFESRHALPGNAGTEVDGTESAADGRWSANSTAPFRRRRVRFRDSRLGRKTRCSTKRSWRRPYGYCFSQHGGYSGTRERRGNALGPVRFFRRGGDWK